MVRSGGKHWKLSVASRISYLVSHIKYDRLILTIFVKSRWAKVLSLQKMEGIPFFPKDKK
jgi:hypothetical protein